MGRLFFICRRLFGIPSSGLSPQVLVEMSGACTLVSHVSRPPRSKLGSKESLRSHVDGCVLVESSSGTHILATAPQLLQASLPGMSPRPLPAPLRLPTPLLSASSCIGSSSFPHVFSHPVARPSRPPRRPCDLPACLAQPSITHSSRRNCLRFRIFKKHATIRRMNRFTSMRPFAFDLT